MKYLVAVQLILWVVVLCSSFTASFRSTSTRFCRHDQTPLDNKTMIRCLGVPRKNIFLFHDSDPLFNYDVISIMNTNITPFGPQQWNSLRHASTILMEDTDLNEIPTNVFGNFPRLQSLFLKSNQIKALPHNAFPNYVNPSSSKPVETAIRSKLSYVDLSGNRINVIEDTSYMASSLETLYLNKNSIQDIDGKFTHLSGLSELHLEDNQIESLTKDSFPNLNSLESLYLDRNPIAQISEDAFSSLTSLKELHMSHTGITTVEWITSPQHKAALQSLTLLDLSYNNLTSLPQELISAFPALTKIDLRRNRWRCDEDLRFLQAALRKSPHTFIHYKKLECSSPNTMKGQTIRKYNDLGTTSSSPPPSPSLSTNKSLETPTTTTNTERAPTREPVSTSEAEQNTKKLARGNNTHDYIKIPSTTPNASAETSSGTSIRHRSESRSSSKSQRERTEIIIVSVSLSALVIGSGIAYLVLRRRRKLREEQGMELSNSDIQMEDTSSSGEFETSDTSTLL